ncbi:hypothetical protein ACSFB8_04115 [Enterococcus faecalis]
MVPGARGKKAGPLNGKLSNYISRLESKFQDKRLEFLVEKSAKNAKFEDAIA